MNVNIQPGDGKRVRVAHVVFTLGTGGIELGLRRLVRGLDPERFEQYVVTVIGSGEVPGATVVSLAQEPHGFKFLVGKFATLFRKIRPDVVHSRNWSTLEAAPGAWLARVPAIVHCEHGRNAAEADGEPLRHKLMRHAYFSAANRLLTVSEDLKRYLCDSVHIAERRIEVIYDGVDTSVFTKMPEARARLRAQLAIPDDAFVIGTVARFDPVKDLQSLLTSAETLVANGRNVHVVLVGYGPERESLQQRAETSAQLRGRVHFSGEAHNVNEWLNTFDAFVLTSLFEGTSVALLEAMATGVVPVVTSVGGNPEVIPDERVGLCFEPRDTTALTQHLDRLIADTVLRTRMGDAARQRVIDIYDQAALFRRYEKIYLELLGRPVKTPPAAISVATGAQR